MKRLNGIKLKHRKNTENSATVDFPVPGKVRIPMSMHMGVPCQPLVKVGDIVAVGQKIGDCDAPFSVPVHSGVSGKVQTRRMYFAGASSASFNGIPPYSGVFEIL